MEVGVFIKLELFKIYGFRYYEILFNGYYVLELFICIKIDFLIKDKYRIIRNKCGGFVYFSIDFVNII